MIPLLPVRRFIGLSWQRYTQHLGRFLEVSLWLLVPHLLQVALLFGLTSSRVDLELGTVWIFAQIFIGILSLVTSTWVSVRLIKLTLAHDPKEEGYIATHPHIGWSLFFPMLLVNVLCVLAVLAGGIAFVLPGIWLAVSLSLAPYVLVAENKRGLHALYASHALIQGRWWPVVGRILVAGLSFLALSFLMLMIVSLLLDLLFGGAMTSEVAQLSRSLVIDHVLTVDTLRGFSLNRLRDGLLTSFTAPFIAIAQAVLYTSLRDSYIPKKEEKAV